MDGHGGRKHPIVAVAIFFLFQTVALDGVFSLETLLVLSKSEQLKVLPLALLVY